MFKLLRNLLPFHRISMHAGATTTSPRQNRKHVARTIFYVTLAVFVLLIVRLTWLVATNNVHGTDIAKAAKANYTATVKVYPQRGTIYDRTGVPIAQDSSTYTLYVNLNKTSVDATGKKLYAQPAGFPALESFLNKELGISPDTAHTSLTRKGAKQVQFGTNGTNISINKMEQITTDAQKQHIMGIGFTADPSRSYPNGIFSSSLVGQATLKTPGDPNSGLVGKNGIEAALNGVLTGRPGTETLEKDQYGRVIPGAIVSQKPAKDGQNVYTTLDANLQTYLEQLMDTSAKQSGGQQLSAVLMDAHSGDILASSQRPTFNPQTGSGSNQRYFTWNNLMYQSAYEPGSTMKTFLVASAIDSRNWHPTDTYFRSLDIDGTDINDWDYNENGGNYQYPTTIDFAQGFAFSSNTGMAKVEMGMGNATWDKYLSRFDFGIPTRMGIGNELFGSLPNSNVVTQAMSAFGQGMSVTQLQMLRGWTSFANGGKMLEPHYINKIVNPDANSGKGSVLANKPEVIGHPITSSTASNIRDLMVTVGSDPTYGTAYLQTKVGNIEPGDMFNINGQDAAVKTGTAQIASPGGGYMTGKQDTINSAVVMWPPQNPDYIFYMTIKIPTNTWFLGFISSVSNPLIERAESIKSEIDDTTLDMPKGTVKVGKYFAQKTGDTEDSMRQQLLAPVAIGTGVKITAQSIKAGEAVAPGTRVLLMTDGDHSMPDMYGWSPRDVKQLAKWYNIKVSYKGGGKKHDKGTVTAQSVAKDVTVKKGSSLRVTLKE